MGKKNYCAVCDKNHAQQEAQQKEKQKKLWILIGSVLGVAALALVLIFAVPWGDRDPEYTDTSLEDPLQDSQPQEMETSPEYTAEPMGLHHVQIEIQDYGTITLELDGNTAPITVENFLTLAESGFYDGLTFHRIMEGFMMQGGDPEGTGSGGSDQTIKGEFSANGVENNISHTRGVISMARNSVSMDSASSQFFIVHEDSTFLDGQYAAFGHVTEGMDVVDAICAYSSSVVIDDNGTIPADAQPVILSVKVID